MSSLLPSIRGIASHLLSRPIAAAPASSFLTTLPTRPPSTTTTTTITTLCLPTRRSLSTTRSLLAPPGAKNQKGSGGKANQQQKKGKRGKKGAKAERDPKIVNMLKHMAILSPKRIPPPLRMGRNRYLRHWTIHRAWLLFRRQQRQERETNLYRQWQSIQRAMEELRVTAGPGTREEGYLYRAALDKTGVYTLDSIPIEYTRPQTETPARVAWNHDWKAAEAAAAQGKTL
ncbi:hypothetical protein VTJ04DRAFT_4318 [Mycothermus thermophilus]|uniref:mitochondrial 54S ribosomal protein mL40 n=1 Tax=Humicola insolens TaxID=85995 RepID=UPI003742A6F9